MLFDYSPDSHGLCVRLCRGLLLLGGLDHGGGGHGLVHGLHVNKSAEKSKQMNVNKCSNLHGRLEALVAAPRVARWRPEDGVDDHQEDAQAQAQATELWDVLSI